MKKKLFCESCNLGERSSEGELLRKCRIRGHSELKGLVWLCKDHIEYYDQYHRDTVVIDEYTDTCIATE